MHVTGVCAKIQEGEASKRGWGVVKKFPNALCVSYITVTFFPRLCWGKNAGEKMKSRFVIPNRRNAILFSV